MKQLAGLGISYEEVRAEVAAGRWHKVGLRSVSVAGPTPTSDAARWRRAVWEVGGRACLDGVTALRALGLRQWEVRRGARVRPAGCPLSAAMWARSDRAAATLLAMSVQQRPPFLDQVERALRRGGWPDRPRQRGRATRDPPETLAVMHIMTVCLGNICRSPAAEAVLLRKLEEAGVADVTVTSAGTADYHVGDRPHQHSVAEGEDRGYVFESVGIQFAVDHFDEADLILAMDSANEADILALARTPRDRAKVVRLGAFASSTDGGVLDVPDPWGQPREAYVRMYDQIEDAVDGLVAAIQDGTVHEVVAVR